MALVDVRAPPRSPAEHLYPENAGLHGSQKDDELQGRNIHAGGEHIHRNGHLGIGAVAEFADLLEGPVHAGAARDLLDEIIPLPEFLPAELHQLIAVGGVGKIIHRKNQDLGEAAGLFLVPVGIGGDFLDNLTVAFGRGDLLFDVLGREVPLIFQHVIGLHARDGVNDAHMLARFEKNALHAHIGFDLHRIIIDQKTVLNRLVRGVAIHHLFEQGKGMGRRRGGQPDLDGIKIVHDLSPDRRLLGCIATVAFICNDDIKGVDGNIQHGGIGFIVRVV